MQEIQAKKSAPDFKLKEENSKKAVEESNQAMSEIERKLKEQDERIQQLRKADEQADKEFIAANPDQAH